MSMAAFVILVGGGALAFGFGGMFLVRRWGHRWGYVPQHDDLLGASYGVAGTAFAVLLAFIVFLGWEHYNTTRGHLEDEAGAVGNLYRLTDGQSAGQREQLREQLLCYTRTVIDDEFPAMADGESSKRTEGALDRLFQTYATLEVSGERESGLYQTALPLLDTIDDSRHDRLLESDPLIPTFAWVILLLGAAVTVAVPFLFYAERWQIQLALTFTAIVLVCAPMFLIRYFDDPFSEEHGLKPTALETAFPPGTPLEQATCPDQAVARLGAGRYLILS
jgi:hypothetical protein